jgi:signal transduction histidine kinase
MTDLEPLTVGPVLELDDSRPEVVRADGVRPEAIRRALADERERLGRDLHDSVIQDLYGVGLLLDAALRQSDRQGATQRVQTAIRTLDASIRRLRSTVFVATEPDPTIPLAELIARVTAGRCDQLGFAPVVQVVPAEARLPSWVLGEVMQFISEALANVARHAQADHALVRVELRTDGGWLIEGHDNGRGFDPTTTTPGFGLVTLQRRAQLLGARLDLLAPPSGGTVVRLRREATAPHPRTGD